MRRSLAFAATLLCSLIALPIHAQAPLETAFRYQGRLVDSGSPANGAFDLSFELFDAASAGNSLGTYCLDDVDVADGLFSVELDFGDAFAGGRAWLAISVRPDAGDACDANVGTYVALTPRREIAPTPNARYAVVAGSAANDAVDDADADPANELQDLSLAGDTLSLSDDATPVDLSGYLDNTDAQDLANVLGQGSDAGGAGMTNLGAVSAASFAGDGSALTGIDVDDADADATNELNATLALNGATLELTDAAGTLTADLSSFLDNTDAQDLANVLSRGTDAGGAGMTNLGAVSAASFAGDGSALTGIDVNDADANPANELQDLSLKSNILSLTNDFTSVDLSGYLDNTDAQNLANVLGQGNDAGGAGMSNLGAVSAASFAGDGSALTGIDVDDADADPANEIQDLSLGGSTLSLTGDATPVDLSALTSVFGDGHSLDASDGNPVDALFVDAAGRVGIGTTTPAQALAIDGPSSPIRAVTMTATAASQSTAFPSGAVSTDPSPSGLQRVWNNPGNALLNDGAVAESILPGDSTTSEWLDLTGFGFSIPPTAQVLGIEMYTRKSAEVELVQDEEIRLLGGSGTSSNRALTTSRFSTRSYGGSSDLWGLSWTPAQINSAGFGARLRADHNDPDSFVVSAFVDYVSITVYYIDGTPASQPWTAGVRASEFRLSPTANLESPVFRYSLADSAATLSGQTGSLSLLLEADSDNSGEADQPSLRFSQDGGLITGQIGYFGATNDMRIETAGATPSHLFLNPQDNVGIKTTVAPAHPLVVGSDTTTGNGAHVTAGGAWTNGSSREFKEGFEALDPIAILETLVALPITKWRYKQSAEGDHIGPVAEEFRAAFGLGHDDQYIATVDADGVALAAIQGLNAKLEAENAALRARNEAFERELRAMRERLEALEARAAE